MNTKLMASVSVLALVLAGCASNEPKPLTETPEVNIKLQRLQLQLLLFQIGIRKCLRKKVQSLL